MIDNKLGEAKLYYLYMMADGEVTESEEIIFDTICKELKVHKKEKDTVIYKCTRLAEDSHNMLKVIKDSEIDIQAESLEDDEEYFREKSSLAGILWNLIYLGYADGFFSPEERKIVDYFKKRWSIEDSIYYEMVDSAETILSLTEHRKWIGSTFRKGKTRDTKESTIDSDISQVINDINVTISELAM